MKIIDIAGVPVLSEYLSGASIDIIRERDLPVALREKFIIWLTGRACPVIEDIPDAVYAWDWQEFCAGENL